jgi:hypothetical protein
MIMTGFLPDLGNLTVRPIAASLLNCTLFHFFACLKLTWGIPYQFKPLSNNSRKVVKFMADFGQKVTFLLTWFTSPRPPTSTVNRQTHKLTMNSTIRETSFRRRAHSFETREEQFAEMGSHYREHTECNIRNSFS